jgi:hypothetical protein
MLTYVKPCHGSFVLKLPRDEEELARIVAEDKKYNNKRKAKAATASAAKFLV